MSTTCPVCGKTVRRRARKHAHGAVGPSLVACMPTGWIARWLGAGFVYGLVDGGHAIVRDTLRRPVLAVAVLLAVHALLWAL